MDDEERKEQIKLVKTAGIAVAVIMLVLAASIIVLATTLSSAGERQFILLMISAGLCVVTAVLAVFALVRIAKVKSRKAWLVCCIGMLAALPAMMVTAVASLIIH